jgi:aryl-alcohol dehydrogenase-like predicted oxidoreductase
MRYKNFGNSGLKISEIAVGTWGIGGTGWGSVDKNQCINAIRTMVDLGVNLIDTAPAYGDGSAEEAVGEAVRGIRDKVIISTKCGIKIDAPRGTNRKKATREEVINGCESSLRRLGIDYINILFLHWPDENTPIEETMTAFNKLKEEGKIRHIGLSNFSISQIKDAQKFGIIDVIQPPFSMVDQSSKEVMLWAHEHNITSMTYGSLGGGILGGKIRTLPSLSTEDVRNFFYGKIFKEPGFSKVMELLKVMDTISSKRKVPLVQIAINWVAQKEYVLTALAGVRSDTHARENCAASDWMLNPDEITMLDAEVERLFGKTA